MTSTVRSHSLPGSFIFGCWLLIFALGFYQPLYANPQSPTVVAGAVQFRGGAGQLDITQSSSHAIINWQNFSIDAGELTRFNQPGANAAILNRVVSGNPSAIHGQLQANGQVFLINPNGILVGPGGQIDTAGFLASTLDVSDREFLAGGDLNFSGDSKASIVNLGKIKTIDGGDIFLLSKTIVNEGTLDAEGRVGLGAGSRILLKASGDERIAILPENQEGSISNKGVIQGAVAELKAAGGNQYALAIQNDGMVRAKGFQNRGGKLYLSAGRGRGVNSGQMSATKKVEIKAPAIENTGTIDASNSESAGGEVVLLGREIELGATSLIIADGATDGGSVFIGGGPRGDAIGGAENAQVTSVAEGSRIQANGSDGVGGKVILWADDTIDYQGHIENTGTTHGGFAEVSGLKTLNFAGTVNTGGGDLLLDPFNYIIDGIAAGNIVTALGSNNVTIDTTFDAAGFGSSGNNLDTGDISVNSNIFYDSTFDLTFLAVGDVNFNASVQNRNATGGDINIVAGWDGTTPFDATTFGAEDIASTTLFGKSDGSINIGDGAQSAGLAVGARAGATSAFGYDVSLLGGSGLGARFAQLGFKANKGVGLSGADLGGIANNGFDDFITGDITALATNDLSARGGTSLDDLNYAQIGHVGAEIISGGGAEAHSNATITVAVGNDLSLIGGPGDLSYTQIGHGGSDGGGNHSGDITVSLVGNDLILEGGSGAHSYSQLGHGGLFTSGDIEGAISINSVGGDLILNSENRGIQSYTQVGHGGLFADGIRHGAIAIGAVGNSLKVSGGNSDESYGQIGHGGVTSDGRNTGDISIGFIGSELNVTGGSGESSYAQLGHGGDASVGNSSGDISLGAAGNLNFYGGSGPNAYAQLGHGGIKASGNQSGGIMISNVGDVAFQAGSGFQTYAQLGHGGESVSGVDVSGDISIVQAGDIIFTGGGATGTYAQLGNGGQDSDSSHSGDITLTDVGDIAMTAGLGGERYAKIGLGGVSSSGTRDGDVSIIGAGDITLTGGLSTSGSGAIAVIGHATNSGSGSQRGDILIREVGDLVLAGGRSSSNFALIGLGGRKVVGNHVGDILISNAGDITLTTTMAGGGTAVAQIGIGLIEESRNSSASGQITISDVGSISLASGAINQVHTQIGHGGLGATGDLSGDISITNIGPMSLAAGSGNRSYSQVGHGGSLADVNIDGSITISASGPINLLGVDLDQYARIGHGNETGRSDAGFSVEGDISIRTTSDITLINAEIGHQIEADGTYMSGNTFLGVGAGGGMQTLRADAASTFFSAPTGELRFYLPSSAANQVAAGASFNGTAAPGPGITPNHQGDYDFGEGPYDLADPGNFAFYNLETTPIVILDPTDSISLLIPDPSPSLAFDFFDYELIRPLDEKFDHLKPLLYPFWTGGIGTPLLLGAVANQYETFNSAPLIITSSNGLLLRTNKAAVGPGIFQSANGATVTINSDGSFDYVPTSSLFLTQLIDGQFIADSFAFVILDEDGNPAGIGTATVLVRGEGLLNR